MKKVTRSLDSVNKTNNNGIEDNDDYAICLGFDCAFLGE